MNFGKVGSGQMEGIIVMLTCSRGGMFGEGGVWKITKAIYRFFSSILS